MLVKGAPGHPSFPLTEPLWCRCNVLLGFNPNKLFNKTSKMLLAVIRDAMALMWYLYNETVYSHNTCPFFFSLAGTTTLPRAVKTGSAFVHWLHCFTYCFGHQGKQQSLAYLTLCGGNPPATDWQPKQLKNIVLLSLCKGWPVDSSHKGPVCTKRSNAMTSSYSLTWRRCCCR